jgi:hypothetical protein
LIRLPPIDAENIGKVLSKIKPHVERLIGSLSKHIVGRIICELIAELKVGSLQ